MSKDSQEDGLAHQRDKPFQSPQSSQRNLFGLQQYTMLLSRTRTNSEGAETACPKVNQDQALWAER